MCQVHCSTLIQSISLAKYIKDEKIHNSPLFKYFEDKHQPGEKKLLRTSEGKAKCGTHSETSAERQQQKAPICTLANKVGPAMATSVRPGSFCDITD